MENKSLCYLHDNNNSRVLFQITVMKLATTRYPGILNKYYLNYYLLYRLQPPISTARYCYSCLGCKPAGNMYLFREMIYKNTQICIQLSDSSSMQYNFLVKRAPGSHNSNSTNIEVMGGKTCTIIVECTITDYYSTHKWISFLQYKLIGKMLSS